MNVWLGAACALLVAGVGPALVLAATGDAIQRLIGMQLGTVIAVPVLLLFAQGVNRPDYLIVPTVLVLLSFAGTLVFTRLLGWRS